MYLWQIIWRDISSWLRRRHLFAMDIESLESLRLIAEREHSSPQEVAARLIQAAAQQQDWTAYIQERWVMLSAREKQVTALVCRGYTTRQIASRLGLSPSTIKTHIENALHKFNLSRRDDLRRLLDAYDLSEYE